MELERGFLLLEFPHENKRGSLAGLPLTLPFAAWSNPRSVDVTLFCVRTGGFSQTPPERVHTLRLLIKSFSGQPIMHML